MRSVHGQDEILPTGEGIVEPIRSTASATDDSSLFGARRGTEPYSLALLPLTSPAPFQRVRIG